MFNKNQIDKLILKMDLSDYPTPSEEQISEILAHGKTRILSTAGDQLDDLSESFFTFCWTQVGRFGFGNNNAIEIGYLSHIPPIYIACAIHRYGMDWPVKLLHMKRITMVDRKKFSVVKCGNNFFSLYDLSRNMLAGHSFPLMRELSKHVRNDNIKEVREIVSARDVAMCHAFVEKPIFALPSDGERLKEKREKVKINKGKYTPRVNGLIDTEMQ